MARIGRIDLKRSAREFFADLFSNPAYQPVDLTSEQIYVADERRPNYDPFDALICAAATGWLATAPVLCCGEG